MVQNAVSLEVLLVRALESIINEENIDVVIERKMCSYNATTEVAGMHCIVVEKFIAFDFLCKLPFLVSKKNIEIQVDSLYFY